MLHSQSWSSIRRLAGFSLSLYEQNYSQFLVLVGGHQHGRAFVLYKEHDEFRRFGLAGVPPNDVDVIRGFVEGLTRC